MTLRGAATAAMLTATAALLAWVLFVGLPRFYVPPETGEPAPAATASPAPAPAPAPPAKPGRKIKASLFYLDGTGTALAPIEREVPYADSTIEQAKAIITAQIAPVDPPLISPVPPGTALRALFVTPAGEAYLDLSRELVAAHPGGSTNELLTIYALVDALTVNLPAVTAVQLLVEGQELDTLAGHVDLRRPLVKKVQ